MTTRLSGHGSPLGRDDAAAADAADALADFRASFVIDDETLLYLDGNSLGRLPKATPEFLAKVVTQEWGSGLVRSWDTWIDWNTRLGDRIGRHVLGARPGEVALSDSTSVNLYKLAAAALEAKPGRKRILIDREDFPTNRYLLQGLAREKGCTLEALGSDLDQGLSPPMLRDALRGGDVALVVLSLVAYRSGALLDMAAVQTMVREAGALVLWDLSHAAGAVPIELERSGAELAVGCTYKYLNGGPGSPAFLYVRESLHRSLRQPLWGWYGQRGQFEMGPAYEPVEGIQRFLVGTPPMLSLAAIQPAMDVFEGAGIERIREKGVRLGQWMVALGRKWLEPLGFRMASPLDPERRGSHVSFEHPEALQISRALRAQANVVADYRTPDRLRLGASPLYTRFVDVWDAMKRLETLVADGHHRLLPPPDAVAGRVT